MRMPFEGNFPLTVAFNAPASWFKSGKHPGIDWACPRNTPLKACFSGVVSSVKYDLGGYGRHLYLKSSDGQFEALYAHCESVLVKAGIKVKEGDLIAHSGRTGYVLGKTGYHLHFGLRKNGVWVDPVNYLNSANQLKIPIKKEVEKTKKDNLQYIMENYVVKRGDTLTSIALDFYGNANLWKKIFVANEKIITNPNKIYCGQVLKIPGFS